MENYNVSLHELPFFQITYICYICWHYSFIVIDMVKYIDSHPNGIYALDAKKTPTDEVFSLLTGIYGVEGSCSKDSSDQVIEGNDIPGSEEREYSHT